MKNIIKFLIIALMVQGIFSCKESIVHDEFNHSYVTTSFGDQTNLMQVNDTMSFIDLSRGIVSRTWTIPEGVAVDEKGEPITTSTSDNFKVSFIKFGTFEVALSQTFKGNVYTDNGQLETNIYDQKLTIQVLDSVRASFTANYVSDDKILENGNGKLHEVQAGRIVNFEVNSTGAPKTNIITLDNKKSAPTQVTAALNPTTGKYVASAKFSKPGIYNISLLSSSDFGNSKVEYTDFIKVIPSTDPVTLDMVERYSEDEIGLVFSRSMQNAVTCSKSAFTISIENAAAPVAAEIVALSSIDNIVKIKMSTKLYNSDIIKISYDDVIGNLITEDLVEAKSFTDQVLTDFKLPNILKDTGLDVGFESAPINEILPYAYWGAPWDKYTTQISTTEAHTGTKSMLASISGGMILSTKTEFDIEKDVQYVVSFWSKLKSINPKAGIDGSWPGDIRFFFSLATDWAGPYIGITSTEPTDKWMYKSVVHKAGATGKSKISLRGNNESGAGLYADPFEIYIDDLSITVYEPRP